MTRDGDGFGILVGDAYERAGLPIPPFTDRLEAIRRDLLDLAQRRQADQTATTSLQQTGVCPNCGYGPVIALPPPDQPAPTETAHTCGHVGPSNNGPWYHCHVCQSSGCTACELYARARALGAVEAAPQGSLDPYDQAGYDPGYVEPPEPRGDPRCKWCGKYLCDCPRPQGASPECRACNDYPSQGPQLEHDPTCEFL